MEWDYVQCTFSLAPKTAKTTNINVFWDCLQVEKNAAPTEWQVGGTSRASDSFAGNIVVPAEWTNIISIQLPFPSTLVKDDLYIRTWANSGGDVWLSLLWDYSEQKWSILSDDATLTAATASTFATGQVLWFAIRVDGTNEQISVMNSDGVEHVAAAADGLVLNSQTLVTLYGDNSSANGMPHVLSVDKWYPRILTDAELTALMSS